jgi:hypothetical protein
MSKIAKGFIDANIGDYEVRESCNPHKKSKVDLD